MILLIHTAYGKWCPVQVKMHTYPQPLLSNSETHQSSPSKHHLRLLMVKILVQANLYSACPNHLFFLSKCSNFQSLSIGIDRLGCQLMDTQPCMVNNGKTWLGFSPFMPCVPQILLSCLSMGSLPCQMGKLPGYR